MPSALVTATLQAATLSSASNVLAQITNSYQNNKPFVFDVYEFLRFVALSFITCPPNYKWQHLLEKQFPGYAPDVADPALPLSNLDVKRDEDQNYIRENARSKLNIKNTLMKWFIDCMTVGALLNTVAFLCIMGFLKGQTAQQIATHVRQDTVPIIVASYKVWPIASIVNFAVIPVEKRIVFLSCVGLLWGIYMSLVAAAM